jgi:4-amino-4-deoxy-L-arabinose transferase-like glycosyltransferase
VVFAFFSVSSSKLPSYILPMFPPLAVLLAGTFGQAQPRRLLLVQALLTAAGAIAVAALLPRAAADYAAYVPWLIGALGCAALGALAAAFLHGKTVHSVLALAIGTFAGTQVALAGHRVLADSYSVAGLVTKAPIPAGATIYAYDTYDHTIPWYTRRTVTMALYTDELEKAIAWEPHKFIRGEHEFASRWNAERAAYAFVSVTHYERLAKYLPMAELGRDPRYVLVRKP